MASVFTGFDTYDPWPAKMYSRTPTAPKGIIRMDPDCAVCHGPATLGCDCEAKGLEVAIKQAEGRMMQAIYNDIRYAPNITFAMIIDMLILCSTVNGSEDTLKTTSLSTSAPWQSGGRQPIRTTWTASRPRRGTSTVLLPTQSNLPMPRRA